MGRREHDPINGIRARLMVELDKGCYSDSPAFEAALTDLCRQKEMDFDVEWELDVLRAEHDRPMMSDEQVAAILAEDRAKESSDYVARELGPEDDTSVVPTRELETA